MCYSIITSNNVPVNIYSFIEDINENAHNVNSLSDMRRLLASLVLEKKMIIYYSGHGLQNGIKLPSAEIMQKCELYEWLEKKQVDACLAIFDCCSQKPHLPFFSRALCVPVQFQQCGFYQLDAIEILPEVVDTLSYKHGSQLTLELPAILQGRSQNCICSSTIIRDSFPGWCRMQCNFQGFFK